MDSSHMQASGLTRIGRAYSRVAIVLVLLFLVFHLISSRKDLTTFAINESPASHNSTPFTAVDQSSSQKPTSQKPHPSSPEVSNLNHTSDQAAQVPSGKKTPQTPDRARLITDLINKGERTFQGLLTKQSNTLEQAAAAYRTRRGRHPPPGFDKWFEYAQANDAVIVEEFWDQIYHDLEPFWGSPPAQIRARARSLGMAVAISDGRAVATTDWFWHVIWGNMIDKVAYMLPDMVIPMNSMDEPRIMVPWDHISAFIEYASANKAMPPVDEVHPNITGWRQDDMEVVEIPITKWVTVPPYTFARAACSPESPIKKDFLLYNSGSVSIEEQSKANIRQPFVTNSTLSSDTCQDPAIAAYHAALISPLSGSTSQILQPLFGGSKFAVNNEILLPAPMYWNGEERFEMEDKMPWSKKQDTVIWRGTATGGRHNALNWPQFHRHRFIALANGTKYTNADPEHDRIFTPAQRIAAIDPLPSPIKDNLAKWLDSINNAAFTDHFCDNVDAFNENEGGCWYTNSEFSIETTVPLAEQFTHKYLPDIDGNSFSGRYRTFLFSNSLPIKATLYREWHDSRLIAWKHFVPMNNRFTDYYSLLAYFIGCDAETCGADGVVAGHDEEAQKIAEAGAEWARKVLRKVDMQIYVARLLLEYGRITDDNRQRVGWVDDLLKQQKTHRIQDSEMTT